MSPSAGLLLYQGISSVSRSLIQRPAFPWAQGRRDAILGFINGTCQASLCERLWLLSLKACFFGVIGQWFILLVSRGPKQGPPGIRRKALRGGWSQTYRHGSFWPFPTSPPKGHWDCKMVTACCLETNRSCFKSPFCHLLDVWLWRI